MKHILLDTFFFLTRRMRDWIGIGFFFSLRKLLILQFLKKLVDENFPERVVWIPLDRLLQRLYYSIYISYVNFFKFIIEHLSYLEKNLSLVSLIILKESQKWYIFWITKYFFKLFYRSFENILDKTGMGLAFLQPNAQSGRQIN